MKRKGIAICLLFAMLFTLGACGTKDEDTENTGTVYGETTKPSGGVYADGTNAPETHTAMQSDMVKVVVPEGYTLLRISWLLEEKGICTSKAFVDAAQSYDLSGKPLLADVQKAKNVCFPLEGYLFPATYEFKKNTDAKTVLDKMVASTAQRFTQEMRDKAKAMGYSVHEILTVASIIEKEAFTAEQRTLIASVLYNRLKAGMQLQCDVTVKYCTGVIQEYYPDKIDHYKYYYNTYRCKALPAGPICNPGMASINAALNPDKTDYLYFVIDTEPPYESRFTNDFAEHQKNAKEMGFA